MEPGRRYLAVTCLVLAAVLLYVGSGYFGPDPVEREAEPDEASDQQISGFTLNESISDTEVWLLESPNARRSGDEIDLTSPYVTYRVDGDTRITVTAERGTYSLDTRLLVLRENVRLERRTKNQILETDTLHWDRPEGVVRTDARVILRMPRGVLRARGMRTRLREETVQFLSDVEFSSR